MGLINIGVGLSDMGNAVAATAGQAALTQQKEELENQRELLINQLSYQREHLGRVEQGQIQSGLQKQQQTAEASLETQRETSAQKIASMEIGAQAANVRAQIAAQGWTLQFDQKSGNPMRVNSITGDVKPLAGTDGKPLSVVNTALVPIAMATVNSNNEQMRAENEQYSTQMASLNQQMKASADAATAVTPEAKQKAMEPFQKEMFQLTTQHNNVLESLRDSSSQAVGSLYAKGATEQDAQPAPQGSKAPTPPPSPAAARPMGSGTQADPYRAGTQSQIDWFKSNAKPGAVIVINGQTYTK
jgi:hypothetical protein